MCILLQSVHAPVIQPLSGITLSIISFNLFKQGDSLGQLGRYAGVNRTTREIHTESIGQLVRYTRVNRTTREIHTLESIGQLGRYTQSQQDNQGAIMTCIICLNSPLKCCHKLNNNIIVTPSKVTSIQREHERNRKFHFICCYLAIFNDKAGETVYIRSQIHCTKIMNLLTQNKMHPSIWQTKLKVDTCLQRLADTKLKG